MDGFSHPAEAPRAVMERVQAKLTLGEGDQLELELFWKASASERELLAFGMLLKVNSTLRQMKTFLVLNWTPDPDTVVGLSSSSV
ncbi:hypothetical protein BT69DRAFT_1278850 [Atractiella rhizophila]|nr:hypothetical protein BT69DRAFT_1278850 [Atractiella rhizophila]